MKKITKFYLNRASYIVGDDVRTDLLMIDYKNNEFKYGGKLPSEVSKIARDLLKRKHGVNFADKIRVY